MIILPFIPILALIVQTSLTLSEILQERSEVTQIEEQVSFIFLSAWLALKVNGNLSISSPRLTKLIRIYIVISLVGWVCLSVRLFNSIRLVIQCSVHHLHFTFSVDWI